MSSSGACSANATVRSARGAAGDGQCRRTAAIGEQCAGRQRERPRPHADQAGLRRCGNDAKHRDDDLDAGSALLAAMNTASEYGFGGVIAALPGFMVVGNALKSIPDPLVNAAVSVSSLAGITGSASGGMSIALAAMSDLFIQGAQAAQIPLEVLHRVVAMASGGMDTLPHNGAVITLLAVTGLTHKQSYREIFAVTVIKTLAVFFVIAVYYLTGLV
jgi:H+/gluconate symporter-like permease